MLECISTIQCVARYRIVARVYSCRSGRSAVRAERRGAERINYIVYDTHAIIVYTPTFGYYPCGPVISRNPPSSLILVIQYQVIWLFDWALAHSIYGLI